SRNFFPLATLLNSAELLQAALQIVIVGPRQSADVQALLRAAYRHSLPNRILIAVDSGEALPAGHPAAGKTAIGGPATAYRCRRPTRPPPITPPPRPPPAPAPGSRQPPPTAR